MEERKCTKCDQKKSFSEFHKNKNKPGGIQGICKICCKEVHRLHYLENKLAYRDNAKKRRETLQKMTDSYKNRPCMDCKQSFPACCMDFDHRNNKLFNVSDAVKNGLGVQTILDEIKKCDVVCANCHRIRTCEKTQV